MSTIPKNKLKVIRRIISGKENIDEYPSVVNRIHECHYMPTLEDLTLTACNQVLEGYGVEPIRGAWVDGFHGDCCAEYVNMGDTYDQTVVYDVRKDKYTITSWGDFVEHAPKYYGIV